MEHFNHEKFMKLKAECYQEKARLDAIENGFSIWQEVNLSTAKTLWFCQHSIEGIAQGDTMREAIDNALARIN